MYDQDLPAVGSASDSCLYMLSRRRFLRSSALGALGVSFGGLILGACAGEEAAAPGGQNPPVAAASPAVGGGDIAFSFGYTDVPIYGPLQRAAEALASERGYTLLTDSARADLDAQVSALESYIQRGVAAMTVLPLDPTAIEAIASRAREAGVLFITYSLDLENQDGSVLFPPDVSGQVLADHLLEWLQANSPDGAEVLLLNNRPQAIGDLRLAPVKEALAGTNARIVAEQDANEPTTGLRVTEDVLRANPNLNVVIGMNDDGALGAVQAFRNTNKDPSTVYIGGQDGSQQALEAIKEGGFFKATAALDLAEVGRAVVGLPADIIEGKEPKGTSVELLPVLASADTPEVIDKLLKSFE